MCGRNFIHGTTSLALKGLLKALSFAFGEWTIGSLVVLAPASIRTIRIFPWNSLAQRVSQVCCTATSTVRLFPSSVSVSPLENFYTSFLYWLSPQSSNIHRYSSTSYHLPEASSSQFGGFGSTACGPVRRQQTTTLEGSNAKGFTSQTGSKRQVLRSPLRHGPA